MNFLFDIKSDVGLVRQRNEDMAAAIPEKGIFLLADGMGGHAAGDLASRVAIETVLAYLTEPKIPGRPRARKDKLLRAVTAANQAVQLAGHYSGQQGMGTTLVCLWVGVRQVDLVHVGDSRAYRYRSGKLEQITNDHTVLRYLLEEGEVEKGSAEAKQVGHILTQAIGLENMLEPEVLRLTYKPGDVFLLCSDGLSDLVADEAIAHILEETYPNYQEASQALIQAALDAGGNDNVTVVLAAHAPES